MSYCVYFEAGGLTTGRQPQERLQQAYPWQEQLLAEPGLIKGALPGLTQGTGREIGGGNTPIQCVLGKVE